MFKPDMMHTSLFRFKTIHPIHTRLAAIQEVNVKFRNWPDTKTPLSLFASQTIGRAGLTEAYMTTRVDRSLVSQPPTSESCMLCISTHSHIDVKSGYRERSTKLSLLGVTGMKSDTMPKPSCDGTDTQQSSIIVVVIVTVPEFCRNICPSSRFASLTWSNDEAFLARHERATGTLKRKFPKG